MGLLQIPASSRLAAALLLLLSACSGAESEAAKWKQLSPAPSKRTEVTAVAVGDKVYVIGGFASDGKTVANVDVYDTKTDSYTEGPPLPIAVNHAMSASIGDTIVVMGGYKGPELTNATAAAFMLRDNRWVALPNMPEPRAAGGAAFLSRKQIVVAGGVYTSGIAKTTLIFDIPSGTWSKGSGLITPREHLGVASDGQRVYAMGGRAPSNLAAAEVFDIDTGKWTRLPDMPTARGGVAATFAAGLIVVPGGEAADTFKQVEAYDVDEGKWLALPSLPTPRHGLGVAAVGTIVYVIEGGPEPGFAFSDATEALDVGGF